jgi:hypothetical protein
MMAPRMHSRKFVPAVRFGVSAAPFECRKDKRRRQSRSPGQQPRRQSGRQSGRLAQLIDQPRFDSALALVRAGYEDLIGLRDQLSPTTHILLQQYDYAIPDGRGICNKGPRMSTPLRTCFTQSSRRCSPIALPDRGRLALNRADSC